MYGEVKVSSKAHVFKSKKHERVHCSIHAQLIHEMKNSLPAYTIIISVMNTRAVGRCENPGVPVAIRWA